MASSWKNMYPNVIYYCSAYVNNTFKHVGYIVRK